MGEIQGERCMDSIIRRASHVEDELSSLDAFSSVSHSVSRNASKPSEVDVVFKLREAKKRYTLGSTINKQGRVGFEASAFFPSLMGTLSTSRLSIETFGSNSREVNISHFTPRVFSSSMNMVYSLSKSLVDYSKCSAFTESSFGSLVRFSDPANRHNFAIESRIRELPRSLHSQIEAQSQGHAPSSKELPSTQGVQSLKNSLCYSWNHIKSSTNREKEPPTFAPFKISSSTTTQQLSLEVTGFGGDVSFVKTQGFYTWSSKLSRTRENASLLKHLNLDVCLGLGALLPNFLNRPTLRTSVHDRFFLGGNCGAHYCLPGFAPRSVGSHMQVAGDFLQERGSYEACGERGNVCLGANAFVSSEVRVSHPIDLSKVGVDVRPNLEAHLSGAVVLDKGDCMSRGSRSLLGRFGEGVRAAAGLGFSLPFGPADLSLMFSAPIKCQKTDMPEGFQLGMRMTYAPL